VGRGCNLWRDEALAAPAIVKVATNQYREESDIVALFIEECCVLGEGCTVKKAALYASYTKWCKNSGEEPLTRNDFGTRLKDKGYSEARTKDRFWKGIGLSEL
jgi:putative DNA primase/helicase